MGSASDDILIKSDDNEIWFEGGGILSESAPGDPIPITVHREDLSGAATSPASVTVRLKSAAHGDITASPSDYAFDGINEQDHLIDPDTRRFSLTFAPDQSTRTFNVYAPDDDLAEQTEWLKVLALYANATYSDQGWEVPLSQTLPTQVFIGIQDNEPPPALTLAPSIQPSELTEGESVSLSANATPAFPQDTLNSTGRST